MFNTQNTGLSEEKLNSIKQLIKDITLKEKFIDNTNIC